ncbi:hypothetical protein EU528_13735 [Candidatus Thorarchaeota archaeon]|nr:MAG: hypothetical protein EU528_13735 [Candidatus Thorarchaeota archaeon]
MAIELDMYIQATYNRFDKDGFIQHNEIVNGIDVTIAKQQEFRLSWMATKMHYTGIYGVLEHITQQDAELFSTACFECAKKNYSGRRGLQSGFSSISALISRSVDVAAKEWVTNFQKKHFASFEIPVIIDLSSNELLFCQKKPLWGRIYYGSFHEFIYKYYRP